MNTENRKDVATPNDSSSETAEGGGGLAQPVPNGGAHESRPESADAPDAEAQAVTDRSRPEQLAAAPLLGVAGELGKIPVEALLPFISLEAAKVISEMSDCDESTNRKLIDWLVSRTPKMKLHEVPVRARWADPR